MPYNIEWLKPIACRHCGQTFKTAHARRRYCSDRCWTLAHPYRAPKWPRWAPSELRQLRELAGTMSVHEIAERIGRSYTATRAKAKQLKISLICYGQYHPTAKHGDALVEQARQMYDEGVKARAIAGRLGLPLSTVEKYVYYQKRLGPPVDLYLR